MTKERNGERTGERSGRREPRRRVWSGVPLAALVVATTALVARKVVMERAHPASTSGAFTTTTAGPAGSTSARWAPTPFAPDASAAGAATTFHGDPQRRHRARGTGPRRVSVAFQTNVGGAVGAQVVASPDGATLYAVTLGGQLVALTLGGEQKWSFTLGDRAYGAPAIADDGTIFVGSDKRSFFAISPAGRLVYKLDVDGEADVAPLLLPAPSDAQVVFAAGDTVYALRKGGDLSARFRAKRKVYSAPTLLPDGRIAFGAQDHRLYVLGKGLTPGAAIDLGADVDCAAAVMDDGALVVGTDGGEVVSVGRAGEILWRTKVSGYVRGGVTVTRSGDVVVGTFGPVPRVVRLSANGSVLGAFEIQGTGAKDFGIWGSPLEDDAGSLYFGTQDDRVIGLSASGAPIFSYSTQGDVDAPVTMLADGSLVVGSEDGTVTRLLP